MNRLIKMMRYVPIFQRMRFERSRKQLKRKLNPEIAEARKTGDRNLVRKKEHDLWFELAMIDEDEECFYTKRLLKQARRYKNVIIPDKPKFKENDSDFEGNEDWSYGPQYDLFLTAKGIHKITEQIRREKKWRWERLEWVKIIGAISGWVAFFLK